MDNAFSIPEGTLCAKCKKRKATTHWVGKGSTLDLIHGNFEYRCEICCLKEQIKNAEKVAANLPKLREELQRLRMGDGLSRYAVGTCDLCGADVKLTPSGSVCTGKPSCGGGVPYTKKS